MKDDYEKDVKEFVEAADDAKDPDIEAFAAKIPPTLQQHLNKMKAIEKTL